MPRVKQPTPQEVKREETEKKLVAAVGNTNQEQVDKRNAIADRADEVRASEMQEFDGDKLVLADPEELKAEQEAKETEAERARLEAEANEEEARRLQSEGVSPRKYTLKVNGRDVEMTEEEVIQRASKVAAADEYLQTAAEAVKRATALGPSREDTSANVGDADIEDTLTSALQGDREAIKKIARALRPALTPEQVQQVVDERTSFRDAVNQFRANYQDLTKDPHLWQLVVAEDKRIAETEPALSYEARLTKAGETIRTWKAGFSKVSDTNPKLQRKASVAPVPAAGGRQSVREEEEAEEPVDKVIDAMAKARGQAQAIRTPQGMFGGKTS